MTPPIRALLDAVAAVLTADDKQGSAEVMDRLSCHPVELGYVAESNEVAAELDAVGTWGLDEIDADWLRLDVQRPSEDIE